MVNMLPVVVMLNDLLYLSAAVAGTMLGCMIGIPLRRWEIRRWAAAGTRR